MNQRQKILLITLLYCVIGTPIIAQVKDKEEVKAEHSGINISTKEGNYIHTTKKNAQWFADAGFGLFIHWGISSVKAINISWSMIPGRILATAKPDSAELKRIFSENDYNLNGKKPEITPNQYFEMAKDFNPQNYNPDEWIKAAKDAGFTYAVLTTKHHEGFSMWPSSYSKFSTKNYMNGKDLVEPFVNACRKYGLKVGLYYSPPDWYYEKDVKNFMDFMTIKAHPEYPSLDADLKPRIAAVKRTPQEVKKYQDDYLAMVKGEVTELLTRYGKIDLLWFDGKPPVPNSSKSITAEEIRGIQPDIVINPRLHGTGDFKTFERVLPLERDPKDTDWAEFCNTWTSAWPYIKGAVYRPNGFILGELVKCRSMGINYLLGIGPMASGELEPNAYTNMNEVRQWMKINKPAVELVKRIPINEKSSVPATAKDNIRYMYMIPEYTKPSKNSLVPIKDEVVTYQIASKPKSVKWLATKSKLDYRFTDNKLTIKIPATERSLLVDVIEIEF